VFSGIFIDYKNLGSTENVYKIRAFPFYLHCQFGCTLPDKLNGFRKNFLWM